MSILSKLPIVGRGNESYEPNFKVRFKGGEEGLEHIVALAISQQTGTYVLAEAQLPDPLAKLQVYLKPGYESIGGNAGYVLEARLTPYAGKKLNVRSSHFNEQFEVTKSKNDTYILKSELLPWPYWIDVRTKRPSNEKGIDVHSFVSFGNRLTKEQVGDAIKAFAAALETAVNSAYSTARKTVPKKVVYFAAGEEVMRIQQKPSETDLTMQRQYKPQPSGGNEFENGAKISLEAITSKATFADIGGYQSVKQQLSDFLLAIKNPEEARKQGYTPSKGWLLHGPPGTGKTLFGKALAGEAGAEFVYFNASDALHMYVGQSTKALKAAFEGSQKRAGETKKPVILFIDEIDSIFPKRGTAHDVKVDLVNLFNQYMDGFETKKIPNVYVIAATNRLHEMDASATRAGRFVKVEVSLPDLEARVAIFQVTQKALEKEAETQLFDPGIDYRPLAERTDKFSGADIAAVMREARQKAFRQATAAKQKAVVTTTAADLEAQINNYRRQQQDGSGKGPIGFGRRVGG